MNNPRGPAGPVYPDHQGGSNNAANPQPAVLMVPVTAVDLYKLLRSLDEHLSRIENLCRHILRSQTTMSAQVDQNFLNLQSQVQQTIGIEQSAVTLVQGLASQLATAIAANNNGDSAALPALQAQLASSASSLAAAIAANAPATGTGTNTATDTSTSTST